MMQRTSAQDDGKCSGKMKLREPWLSIYFGGGEAKEGRVRWRRRWMRNGRRHLSVHVHEGGKEGTQGKEEN